jgi:hypothetical protein
MSYTRGFGNIFEKLFTLFTFKMADIGSFVILLFIMDILSQNMTIYDKNVTFGTLWCLCKELPLGVLVIFLNSY